MKVLFVSHLFPPRHQAGAENYAARLMRELGRRDHELAVFHSEKIISRRDGTLVRGEFEGMRRYTFVNNLLYRSLADSYENPAAERAFAEVLQEFDPELVHFHHLLHLSARLPELAKRHGARVVMTLHDFWLQCPRFGQMLYKGKEVCTGPEDQKCGDCLSNFKLGQSAVERIGVGVASFLGEHLGVDLAGLAERMRPVRQRMEAGREETRTFEITAAEVRARNHTLADACAAVDQFFSPSRVVRDQLVGWGLPADRVRCSPYGLDVERFERVPRAPKKPVRVGYLGTISAHKGVHVLVAAAKLLDGAALTIDIYGRSSYYPEYARSLEQAAEGTPVRFRGELDPAEVPRALHDIDVLVVPSLWYENSPLTIHEAFASGLPVIASDLGGMKELVQPGRSGFLFPAGDAAALAAILRRLAAAPETLADLDPPQPTSIGETADELEVVYGALVNRVNR